MSDDETGVAMDWEAEISAGRAALVTAGLGALPPSHFVARPRDEILLAEALHLCGRTDAAIERAAAAQVRAAKEDRKGDAASAASVLAIALARKSDARSLERARGVLEPYLPGARARVDAAAARVLHAEGVLRLRSDELEAARVALLGALARHRAGRNEWRAAAVLDTLGMTHARLGDPLRALRSYGESLAAKRACGDVLGQAITHGNRGRLRLEQMDFAGALEDFDADLELSRRAGDAFGEVVALDGRGLALVGAGRAAEAETVLREAGYLARSRGYAKQEALALKDLARAVELGGRLDDADGLLSTSIRRFEIEGNATAAAYVLTARGRLRFRCGLASLARTDLAQAAGLLRGGRQPEFLADALVAWADASVDSPDEDDADPTALLNEASALAREHRLPRIEREVVRIRSRVRATPAPQAAGTGPSLHLFGGAREFLPVERLGRGGQAETWRALDVETGRLVVVKRFLLALPGAPSEGPLRTAREEFAAAVRIDHPNVVRVHGFERLGDDAYLVLESLPGPDFQRLLEDGRPSPAEALRWIADVAAALDALHRAGIVHRDLKPANVLLGEGGRAVLIDFGVALLGPAPASSEGQICGTVHYMAPEQARGRHVDARADLFSFGVLCVELLTGRNPFREAPECRTVTGYILAMGQRATVQRLVGGIDWPADVPDRERAAVLQLLAPEPEDRWPDAGTFLAAFAGRHG